MAIQCTQSRLQAIRPAHTQKITDCSVAGVVEEQSEDTQIQWDREKGSKNGNYSDHVFISFFNFSIRIFCSPFFLLLLLFSFLFFLFRIPFVSQCVVWLRNVAHRLLLLFISAQFQSCLCCCVSACICMSMCARMLHLISSIWQRVAFFLIFQYQRTHCAFLVGIFYSSSSPSLFPWYSIICQSKRKRLNLFNTS